MTHYGAFNEAIGLNSLLTFLRNLSVLRALYKDASICTRKFNSLSIMIPKSLTVLPIEVNKQSHHIIINQTL